MDVLRLLLIFAFAVFVVLAADEPETTTTTEEPTTTGSTEATTPDYLALCNCDDHCPERKVIGLGKDGEGEVNPLLEEDSDKDGDRSVCARNRDSEDRTFSSVCHMMCFNRCTRFRVWKATEEDKMVSYVAAFRDNFYKLYDGSCEN